jgi:hypothetical protein
VQAGDARGRRKCARRRKPALHPNLKKPPDERAKAILATRKAEPRAGSRRIRDVMRRLLGIGASQTTVRRVLRAEGAERGTDGIFRETPSCDICREVQPSPQREA